MPALEALLKPSHPIVLKNAELRPAISIPSPIAFEINIEPERTLLSPCIAKFAPGNTTLGDKTTESAFTPSLFTNSNKNLTVSGLFLLVGISANILATSGLKLVSAAGLSETSAICHLPDETLTCNLPTPLATGINIPLK